MGVFQRHVHGKFCKNANAMPKAISLCRIGLTEHPVNQKARSSAYAEIQDFFFALRRTTGTFLGQSNAIQVGA